MESPRADGRTAHVTADVAAEVRRRFGTPCYVYDHAALETAARQALAFPAPFGLTVRYAMKANPSRGILALFRELGLHVDASSDFEVERALRAGFAAERIQLTSQMPSRALERHLARGVLFNACSLHQLEEFGRRAPAPQLSVGVKPGRATPSTKPTKNRRPPAAPAPPRRRSRRPRARPARGRAPGRRGPGSPSSRSAR
jgi:diaminopimelate decarboxylase